MNKLFAVLLGGRAKDCNTELHDTVFVVGKSLEEAYPRLVHKWFGVPQRLHIDASVELRFVDGYEIVLDTREPTSNQGQHLFFVNFGAYQAGYFGEIHQASFYVAASKNEILGRAKQELCVSMLQQHCDDNLIIDDITSIDTVDKYYVHLQPTTEVPHLSIESYYRKLDVPEIMEKANALV